eukprot:5612148-Lingulodinium_polyedra.AAC.1
MILDFFKTNRTLQQQYVFQDLANVKWMGDEKIEDFLRTDRHIVCNVQCEVPEHILREVLLKQMKQSK